MRPINVLDPSSQRVTALVYGSSGSGKTHCAGTFPRPLFLSDATEGGYKTLSYMPRSLWYDKEYPPEIHAIETVDDMYNEVRRLAERVKGKRGCHEKSCTHVNKGAPQTVVIDSLTFWADLLLRWLQDTFSAAIEKNHFLLYTKTFEKLKNLLIEVHNVGINVVWICLAKKDEGTDGGPLLPGQIAQKLPAACDLYFYQRAFPMQGKRPAGFELRTKPFGGFSARGRARMPDPIAPTYEAIKAALETAEANAGEDAPDEDSVMGPSEGYMAAEDEIPAPFPTPSVRPVVRLPSAVKKK